MTQQKRSLSIEKKSKLSIETRICIIFAFSLVLMSGAFWLGLEYLSFGQAIGFSIVAVVAIGILFAFYHKTEWASMLFTATLSAAIGLSISAFFTTKNIEPVYYYAAIFACIALYKILTVRIAKALNGKKAGYILFFIFTIVSEIAACVILAIKSESFPELYWIIFFSFLICIFFSCSVIALRKTRNYNFWRSAALCYLAGFVLIFLVVILLAISVAAEDGSPLELLAEVTGEGIAEAATSNKKRKIPKK